MAGIALGALRRGHGLQANAQGVRFIVCRHVIESLRHRGMAVAIQPALPVVDNLRNLGRQQSLAERLSNPSYAEISKSHMWITFVSHRKTADI